MLPNIRPCERKAILAKTMAIQVPGWPSVGPAVMRYGRTCVFNPIPARAPNAPR